MSDAAAPAASVDAPAVPATAPVASTVAVSIAAPAAALSGVEDYVNPTVSRTKRKTAAVIKPERSDDEEDDTVFFLPPKQEAVSYVVEAVLDSKQVGRKMLYLVKWEGFDDEEENTWEPEKNLDDCQDKLEEYWKAHPESAGGKRHAEDLKLKNKRRKSKGGVPFSLVEAALKSLSEGKLLEAVGKAWEEDGDMRTNLSHGLNLSNTSAAPTDDGWADAEDQELMLSWNWRLKDKVEASKYKIEISDGSLKIGTGKATEVLLPEPMVIAKVYTVNSAGEAQLSEAKFGGPTGGPIEEKGLQFDLANESWRMTFERAKPNAMRLRIEVFPTNSTTATQILYAFPNPKGD